MGDQTLVDFNAKWCQVFIVSSQAVIVSYDVMNVLLRIILISNEVRKITFCIAI